MRVCMYVCVETMADRVYIHENQTPLHTGLAIGQMLGSQGEYLFLVIHQIFISVFSDHTTCLSTAEDKKM